MTLKHIISKIKGITTLPNRTEEVRNYSYTILKYLNWKFQKQQQITNEDKEFRTDVMCGGINELDFHYFWPTKTWKYSEYCYINKWANSKF